MSKNVKKINQYDIPEKPGNYHKIICLSGEKKGDAYLIQSARIVLGRADSADIQVLDLKSSREHCEIVKMDDEMVLTDMGSQNGIIVNELRVKQHTLKDGDRFVIGRTSYKYQNHHVLDMEVTNANINLSDLDEDEEYEEEEEKKGLPIIPILIALPILFMIFSGGEEERSKKKAVPQESVRYKEINDSAFSEAIKKKKNEIKKKEEKLQRYFHKGIRELREGNYFRAIREFESARQWSPQDPLAKFYLRKSKEELNRVIDSYFKKGMRDKESLNYLMASTSFCLILRLLNDYPDDERYVSAKAEITKIEEVLGKDEGSINCSQQEGDEL